MFFFFFFFFLMQIWKQHWMLYVPIINERDEAYKK